MRHPLDQTHNLDPQSSRAEIVGGTLDGFRICAAAAGISTAKGTAFEVLSKDRTLESSLNLLRRVLASGHKSVIEHAVFHVAFNNVSAFVEQFIIEFRLASFTVKSRRYVDFSGAGFHVPQGLPRETEKKYRDHAASLFEIYHRLLALDIPKEDARFVLPYCFYSNFYCTCNLRELIYIVGTMLYGRGSVHPELAALGEQLGRQLEALFPGIVEEERSAYPQPAAGAEVSPRPSAVPTVVAPGVKLLSATPDAAALALRAMPQGWRTADGSPAGGERALELANYVFSIENLSLSGTTHLVRHRMQSVLVPHLLNAVEYNRHILPPTVGACPEAEKLYRAAFAANGVLAAALPGEGFPLSELVYLALSGHTLVLVTNINARELIHLLRLRLCTRAQWEIRAVALDMLKLAKAATPELFDHVGPGCYMDGHCPEGAKSCGQGEAVKAFLEAL